MWHTCAHTPLRIIPLGGVDAENILDYLALPIVPAVAGSWLTGRNIVAAKDWAGLRATAKSSLDRIREHLGS